MTKQDRIKWNEKYNTIYYPTEAASVVKRFYHLAPGERALDIAAGNGRNAVFLARKGFVVDAVDISDIGLAEFSGTYSNINAICADLDQFEIFTGRYDLIVNVKFLNRRLFPYIKDGLKEGGIVIFEALLEPDCTEATPKHSRDYLLRTNELLNAFSEFQLIYYSETQNNATNLSHGTATLVGAKQ
jgi:SAM-dependent methyltransferase